MQYCLHSFLKISVLILYPPAVYEAVQFIQTPSKQGQLTVFGQGFSGIALGLNKPFLKSLFFFDNSSDIVNPLSGIVCKMIDSMVESFESCSGSVRSHFRFQDIFIKFKQILDDKELLLSHFKRNRQFPLLLCHSGMQYKAFFLSHGT